MLLIALIVAGLLSATDPPDALGFEKFPDFRPKRRELRRNVI